MSKEQIATIETDAGDVLNVALQLEGERHGTALYIDGVPHHFERVCAQELSEKYHVDTDPDYVPRTDQSGFCYVLVPFSI